MRRSRRRGEERILTVPNGVTVIRLLCIPLFVWLLVLPNRSGWFAAALLLAGLGITDGVDGYVARHFDQVSTVGKVLDPLADRLLLGVAAIATVLAGAIPVGVAVAALTREALVAAGFVVVALAGGRRVEVQWAGKAGTFGLMCALPLFVVGHSHEQRHQVAETLAWIAVIPALALAWYAAITYLPMARAALAEDRRQRQEAAP
jgi:cardiolipin synthase (CMP-forming)